MKFYETPAGQDHLDELLEAHYRFIKGDLTTPEIEVLSQKSRWFKFRCWLIYGHLVKKPGNPCLRCGKVISIKNNS